MQTSLIEGEATCWRITAQLPPDAAIAIKRQSSQTGRIARRERASSRGNHMVMVAIPIESAINISDHVSLSSLWCGGAVKVVQDLSLGYGLGR